MASFLGQTSLPWSTAATATRVPRWKLSFDVRARSVKRKPLSERSSPRVGFLCRHRAVLCVSRTAKVLLIAVLPVTTDHISDALFVFPLMEHPLTAPRVRGCHLAPPSSSAFCAQRCAPPSHPPRTFTHAHIVRIAHTHPLAHPRETLVLVALQSPSPT